MENNSTQTVKAPTAEDRMRIFIQYMGQVFNINSYGAASVVIKFSRSWFEVPDPMSNHGTHFRIDPNDVEVKVKPLSKISDEDKLHCYHLHSAHCKYDETQTHCSFLEAADQLIKREGIKCLYCLREQADLLRARGYALPYGQWSVDELVGFGIFKLTE